MVIFQSENKQRIIRTYNLDDGTVTGRTSTGRKLYVNKYRQYGIESATDQGTPTSFSLNTAGYFVTKISV